MWVYTKYLRYIYPTRYVGTCLDGSNESHKQKAESSTESRRVPRLGEKKRKAAQVAGASWQSWESGQAGKNPPHPQDNKPLSPFRGYLVGHLALETEQTLRLLEWLPDLSLVPDISHRDRSAPGRTSRIRKQKNKIKKEGIAAGTLAGTLARN